MAGRKATPYHRGRKKLHLLILLLLLAGLLLLIAYLSGCIWAGQAAPVPTPGPGNGVGPPPSPTPDPEEEARRRQAEWEQRNADLKERLGKFYVPPPPLDQPENPRVTVRALYMTGHTVGLESRYRALLDLIDRTELNAVVIDVKDDHGKMTYRSNIEIVKEVDAHYKPVPITDIRATLDELHAKGIYTIARIVVFKDPYLARAKPEWAIQANAGGLWTEKGVAWINPYQEEVWEYNIAIAKEAANLGFREIQFDYIRFPENARRVDREAYYPGRDGRPKAQAIDGFLRKARAELAEYNAYLACDVFGVIATSWADHDDIGQIWENFAPHIDYTCPMIYPSHYGPGYFGYPVPDAEPAGTITRALTDALKRNAPIEKPAIIRPWLQAFTATWVPGHIPYGAAEVRRQIDAALALGIEEYMLWNAGNVYPAGALLTEAEAERRAAEYRERRREKGHDFLNRTAREAANIYLAAVQKRDWREAYALQISGGKTDGDRYRDWLNGSKGRLKSWAISAVEAGESSGTATLDLIVTVDGKDYALEGERWTVRQENNVWRIEPSAAFLELVEGKAPAEADQPPPNG